MNSLSKFPAPGDDPDADILPALAAGDEGAFAQLMDRHLRTIQSLASHMLGDPVMAEDVTQSVFLKTWRMVPHWEPGSAKLITWMRRVATNQCLDHLKKKRPVLMETLPDIAGDGPEAFEHMAESDEQALVERALAQLSERHRLALTLSYFQSVTQVEGAGIMNISVEAYESLLVRARKALRVVLEKDPKLELEFGGAK